ncbi:MAG: recombination mediator RecR [candidate division WOR-3 bacterium]|nr:recombination mediator RecR [candidate division WOR-3 bacterium]
MKPPKIFLHLTQALQVLPGIGEKSANRIAFYLLSNSKEGRKIALSLEKVLADIKFCSVCGNITIEDPCLICSSPERDRSTICVVQKPMDVFAIERAGIYNGLYHVLGGLLSPLEDTGPEDINITSLIKRVKGGNTGEVIIATNPTTEGEATAIHLEGELRPLGVKMTRIARGIPVGTDLDFADDITLLRALEGRIEFKG